jgi:hypothetical protein
MALPGADPEHLLIRTTTVSLVLHALLDRLQHTGVLAPADMDAIEQFCLDLAAGLEAYPATGPQVAGARLARDVRAYLAAVRRDAG